MYMTALFLALVVGFSPGWTQATSQPGSQAPKSPRRTTGTARTGSATFAIRVTDPAGQPVGDVKVTLDGPSQRQSTTEGGRIAFENLPAGTYHLRFEHEGFLTQERDVVARGTAPIDVKVTLTPAPKPVAPLPAPEQPAPSRPSDANANATPVAIDLPAFISKNFVGRESQKISSLACSGSSSATLIQLHDPLTDHSHPDFDEYLYVIAGQGLVRIQGKDQALSAGVFVLVPRATSHALAASGRNPLVLLSIRSGDRCTSGEPGR
jgi:mannose-6-phosphate isomerase-like protein (cupin superfamily)